MHAGRSLILLYINLKQPKAFEFLVLTLRYALMLDIAI